MQMSPPRCHPGVMAGPEGQGRPCRARPGRRLAAADADGQGMAVLQFRDAAQYMNYCLDCQEFNHISGRAAGAGRSGVPACARAC